MGAKMGKNCCGPRPLLIYLAGVLFPEGAVAGGRWSPLSFHSITSSARASNGDTLRVGLCGLEIISFISSFRRSHHRG
jgi:hypothetical protein